MLVFADKRTAPLSFDHVVFPLERDVQMKPEKIQTLLTAIGKRKDLLQTLLVTLTKEQERLTSCTDSEKKTSINRLTKQIKQICKEGKAHFSARRDLPKGKIPDEIFTAKEALKAVVSQVVTVNKSLLKQRKAISSNSKQAEVQKAKSAHQRTNAFFMYDADDSDDDRLDEDGPIFTFGSPSASTLQSSVTADPAPILQSTRVDDEEMPPVTLGSASAGNLQSSVMIDPAMLQSTSDGIPTPNQGKQRLSLNEDDDLWNALQLEINTLQNGDDPSTPTTPVVTTSKVTFPSPVASPPHLAEIVRDNSALAAKPIHRPSEVSGISQLPVSERTVPKRPRSTSPRQVSFSLRELTQELPYDYVVGDQFPDEPVDATPTNASLPFVRQASQPDAVVEQPEATPSRLSVGDNMLRQEPEEEETELSDTDTLQTQYNQAVDELDTELAKVQNKREVAERKAESARTGNNLEVAEFNAKLAAAYYELIPKVEALKQRIDDMEKSAADEEIPDLIRDLTLTKKLLTGDITPEKYEKFAREKMQGHASKPLKALGILMLAIGAAISLVLGLTTGVGVLITAIPAATGVAASIFAFFGSRVTKGSTADLAIKLAGTYKQTQDNEESPARQSEISEPEVHPHAMKPCCC